MNGLKIAMQIQGYHCTERHNVKNILENNFEDSIYNNWMGKGVYFFGDGPDKAGVDEACRYAVNAKKITNWTILSADIKGENPLDLINDIDAINKFKELRKALSMKHSYTRKAFNCFSDNVVFEFIDKKFKFDFYIARINGGWGYCNRPYVVFDLHVQICVKNKNCIYNVKTCKEN